MCKTKLEIKVRKFEEQLENEKKTIVKTIKTENKNIYQGQLFGFKFHSAQNDLLSAKNDHRSAIVPYYPQAIRSIDQGWFQNILLVFNYVRLGQVRLRRALRSAIGPYYPQAIQSIDQGRFQNILLVLHYVRLGQVRLRRALRSAIGPYYPQAIWSIDQGWFQNILIELHYVRLGQVRVRRALRSAIGP